MWKSLIHKWFINVSTQVNLWIGLVALMALAGTILRALAVPQLVSDVDSVNFAWGLDTFDPLKQSPHFPGYPVYMAAASLFRLGGVSSDVWALTLPGIIIWPFAAMLFFLGVQHVAGRWPAFGAVAVSALSPGACLVGGWPGSDSFGFGLLLAALGCLAMGAGGNNRTYTSPKWILAGGILLGFTLGVRLSWTPAVAAIAMLIYMKVPADRRTLVWGTLGGTAVWALPLILMIGLLPLWQLGMGFIGGHLTQWGGTTLSIDSQWHLSDRLLRGIWTLWDVGLAGAWPFAIPMTDNAVSPFGKIEVVLGLIFAASLVLGGSFLGRRPKFTDRSGQILALAVLAALPYTIWLVGFQNVTKFRHFLIIMPLIGSVSFYILRHFSRIRVLVTVVVLGLMSLSTYPRANIQGNQLVPSVALVQWITQNQSPEKTQLFAGEEARIFQHFAKSHRVHRITNASVLTAEVTKLHQAGVRVFVTSEAYQHQQLISNLKPVKTFIFPANINANDAQLILFEYKPNEAVAVRAVEFFQ